MKIIILAAGYGTRLYPLTKDKPKPLLPVAGKPILDYIISKLEKISGLTEVYVVTNNRFYDNFVQWNNCLDTNLDIEIIDDGTTSPEDRLGAVKDISFVVNEKNIDENLLVVGGDNLFGFSLSDFADKFEEIKLPLVGIYRVEDESLLKEYGTVKIDEQNKITEFVEKSETPESDLVATCIYFIPKKYLKTLAEYVSNSANIDTTGSYIQWLMTQVDVYGYLFEQDWFDIGSLESYEEACREYGSKVK